MSQILATRNSIAKRRRNNSSVSFHVKSFMLIMCIGIVASFLSVAMLVNFNKVATKGYTIKHLEVQQKQLWNENEQLKKDLLEQKALSVINASNKASRMVEPGKVTYVSGHKAIAQKID